MSSEVQVSSLPFCDFCRAGSTKAEYDGKTHHGPWANMCRVHFATHGVGLGTGRGQRLILAEK